MLLQLFRGNQPILLIIIPLIGGLLMLNSFMAPTGLPSEHYMPLYELIASMSVWKSYPIVATITAYLLILLQAFLLPTLNGTFRFVEQRTFMSAILFIIMSTAIPKLQTLHPVHFANIFFIFAIQKIFSSYEQRETLKEYFEASFLLCMGALFYQGILLLLPVLWLSTLIFKGASIREWLITILALATVFFIVSAIDYLFYSNWHHLADTFYNCVSTKIHAPMFAPYLFLFIGYVILLLVLASYHLVAKFQFRKISSRKYFQIFFWVFTTCVSIYFIMPSVTSEIFAITAVPAAFIMSNFFIGLKSKAFGQILFILLFVMAAINQFA